MLTNSCARCARVVRGAVKAVPTANERVQRDRQKELREMTTERATQRGLVEHLQRSDVLRTPRVREAMQATDRSAFVDPACTPEEIYWDAPLGIGHGQTISAPHMHAEMLELLEPYLQSGAKAADVGAGSGYLTAALRRLVGPEGRVVAVEQYEYLAERARAALQRELPGEMADGSLMLIEGNALSGVLEPHAPFDAIHVGAAASNGASHQLLRLLRPGGRMVIPVGERFSVQVLKCMDKDEEGNVTENDIELVGFVPLTGPEEPQEPR